MAVIGSVLPDLLFGAALTGGTTGGILKHDLYVSSCSGEDFTLEADNDRNPEPDLYNLTPVVAIDASTPDWLDGFTAIERLVDEDEWPNGVIELVCETHVNSSGEDDDCSVCLTDEDLAGMLDDDSSSLSSSYSSSISDHSISDWERLEDSNSDSSSLNGEILPDLSRLINGSKSTGKTVSISHREPYHSRLSEQSVDHIQCKSKRGAKNVLLWKFLLNMLDTRSDLVQWVDLEQGTFKFVDTSSISKIWGSEKKKTSRMNFEKLSRGIRHYYKTGLMSRISGQRLIYKFNWEKVPKKYRKC